MGGVLMQYPPWFTAKDREKRERNLATIDHDAEMLAPLPVFVEFRHASWVEGSNLKRTMESLAERDLTFVSVDAPQLAGSSVMPPVTAATARLGYVRLHGRNQGTWSARTASAADRFDYLYTTDELEEWRQPMLDLAESTERTWVMFNNCKYDYAPRNAREMAEVLGDLMAPRLDDEGGEAQTAEGMGSGGRDATEAAPTPSGQMNGGPPVSEGGFTGTLF